jgi:S1-C subfamily serine protease
MTRKTASILPTLAVALSTAFALCLAFASVFAFGPASAVSAETVFEPGRILASVCTVETYDSQGSGLVVTAQGHVLTNAHVIGSEKTCTIYYGDGTYEGTLLRIDKSLDLAVLETDIEDAVPAEFAETEEIRVGMEAFVAGSPEGLPQTITRGIVSVVGQPYYGQLFLQTDASVTYGNSGGPLSGADGRVLGLVAFNMGEGEELAFAIPNPTLLGFLHDAGLLLDRSVSPLEGIRGIPGYYDTSDETYDDAYYSDPPANWLDDPDTASVLLVVSIVEGLVLIFLLVGMIVALRGAKRRIR